MTLDTSSPAHVAVPAARPPDDGDRPSEAVHERPDLGALEALLADPAAVSSEEAAPAGLVAEPHGQDEAGADGDGSVEAQFGEPSADPVPELPTHTPDALGENARDVDGLAAQPPAPDEMSAVPMEHDTLRAELAPLDEAADPAAGESASTRDWVRVDDPLVTPAVENAAEEDASVEDTSAMALPGAVRAESDADPSANEHPDASSATEDNPPDLAAAASTGTGAALLHDTLLRDIAEAPSVSSDSVSSDQARAVDLAVDPMIHDSSSATVAGTPLGREHEPLFGVESPDQDILGAVGSVEAASVQPESADSSAVWPVGRTESNESPAVSQAEASANDTGGAGDEDADFVVRLPAPDEAGARAASAARERPEERGDSSPGTISLSGSSAPGAGSSIVRTGADHLPVAPATDNAVVAEGATGGSDPSDANLPEPAEPSTPAASPAHERFEPVELASGDRFDRGAAASVDTAATLLDNTLLREIAESPAVSSESVSSDHADAANPAVGPLVHDSSSATEAEPPRDRGLGRVLDDESPDSDDLLGADARPEIPEQLESLEPDVGQSIDKVDPVESPAPAGVAAGADGVATGNDVGPAHDLPDLGGSRTFSTDAGHDESILRQIAGVVAASAGEPAIPAEPDSQEIGTATSCDAAGMPKQGGRAAPDVTSLEDPGRIALSEAEGTQEEPAPVVHERPDERRSLPAEASSSTQPTVSEPESHFDRTPPYEPVTVAASEDSGEGDAKAKEGVGTVIHLSDLSGSLPSGTDADRDESLLRHIADVVAASAGEATDPPGPDLPESVASPARGSTGAPDQNDRPVADAPRSEDADVIAPPGPEGSEQRSVQAIPDRPDGPGDSLAEASPLPESAVTAPESPGDDTGPDEATIAATTEGTGRVEAAPAASEPERPFDLTDPDETAAAVPTECLDESESGTEDGAVFVIHLPDLSGQASFATGAGRDESLPRQAADAEAASTGEPAGSSEAASPVSEVAQSRGVAAAPQVEDVSSPDDTSAGDGSAVVLPVAGEAQAPAVPVEIETVEEHGDLLPADVIGADASATTPGIEFDDTLLLNLDGVSPVSSDEAGAPGSKLEALGRSADPGAHSPSAPEPAFDVSLPDAGTALPGESGTESDAEYADMVLGAASPGPAAALAFATDAETEVALRDGLFGFGSASAGTGEPQVWQGGLRAAIAAIAEGRTAPLVIVDIDGVPYPAGAIHELAAVCEVGTVVVAVGSDVSARPGRELLLSGVSDYLAKPLTAEAVRGVASRALEDAVGGRPGGRVACFVGYGGSGATTLAAAVALQAASRGCYVSVLDLSRSVAAAALALGVEPVAGLDQLLETADKIPVEPESLEGVCGRRSDRIEVYAHRWSPEHPAAATAAGVDRLLAALRLRSQLVLVDGLDEAEMRFLPSVEVDTRVFVAEPTTGKTPHLARMMDLMEADRPLVFVRNHTRAFKRNGSGQVLHDAGIGLDPDLTVPFDPSVPETSDRGWPQGTLPRSLRKPVAALTDRLLEASASADAAAALVTARAA